MFWYFWIYSFLGYLLEKVFAKVTQSPQQGRKGFLAMPLCPVYGLGMLAVLALPEVWQAFQPFRTSFLPQASLPPSELLSLRGTLHGKYLP